MDIMRNKRERKTMGKKRKTESQKETLDKLKTYAGSKGYDWKDYLTEHWEEAYGRFGEELKKVVKQYANSVEYDAREPERHHDIGTWYSAMGEYEKAVEKLTKAIELRPTYASAYHKLGVCFSRLGNREETIKNLEKAFKLASGNAVFTGNVGLAYLWQKKYKEAESYLKVATGLAKEIPTSFDFAPYEAAYHLTSGARNLFDRKNLDQAGVDLQEAVKLFGETKFKEYEEISRSFLELVGLEKKLHDILKRSRNLYELRQGVKKLLPEVEKLQLSKGIVLISKRAAPLAVSGQEAIAINLRRLGFAKLRGIEGLLEELEGDRGGFRDLYLARQFFDETGMRGEINEVDLLIKVVREVRKYPNLDVIPPSVDSRVVGELQRAAKNVKERTKSELEEIFSELRNIREDVESLPVRLLSVADTIFEEKEKAVSREKAEEEKLEHGEEIRFERGRVRISSAIEPRYAQPSQLLEYFIIKKEEVHWIEGIRIFNKWRKIRPDIYKLRAIFDGAVSKLRGPKGFFKKHGLNLDITGTDKGFYELKGNYASNIAKARELWEEVEMLTEGASFDIDKVREKVKKAIKTYGNCTEAHIAMVKLLGRIEFAKKDLIRSQVFFTRQIEILKQVKAIVEYYKKNSTKIEWEKAKEETQIEFKNEVGFFLVVIKEELDEMKTWFSVLTKWMCDKSITLPSRVEVEEFKKLLEENREQDLLETKIMKQTRNITKAILLDRFPPIRKWKNKEKEYQTTEILLATISKAKKNIDFSKVSWPSSLKKYLIKLVKAHMYEEFFERIRITKAEWKIYKQVERIKNDLRQKLQREPDDEEWQQALLEKKDRGEEYLKYIEDIYGKLRVASLDRDVSWKEDRKKEDNEENEDREKNK